MQKCSTAYCVLHAILEHEHICRIKTKYSAQNILFKFGIFEEKTTKFQRKKVLHFKKIMCQLYFDNMQCGKCLNMQLQVANNVLPLLGIQLHKSLRVSYPFYRITYTSINLLIFQ